MASYALKVPGNGDLVNWRPAELPRGREYCLADKWIQGRSATAADRYIKEPSEVVKVGQIVMVQVLSADAKVKRIALSIKALTAKAPGVKPPHKNQPKAEKPKLSMDDSLAALANRWKGR